MAKKNVCFGSQPFFYLEETGFRYPRHQPGLLVLREKKIRIFFSHSGVHVLIFFASTCWGRQVLIFFRGLPARKTCTIFFADSWLGRRVLFFSRAPPCLPRLGDVYCFFSKVISRSLASSVDMYCFFAFSWIFEKSPRIFEEVP